MPSDIELHSSGEGLGAGSLCGSMGGSLRFSPRAWASCANAVPFGDSWSGFECAAFGSGAGASCGSGVVGCGGGGDGGGGSGGVGVVGVGDDACGAVVLAMAVVALVRGAFVVLVVVGGAVALMGAAHSVVCWGAGSPVARRIVPSLVGQKYLPVAYLHRGAT